MSIPFLNRSCAILIALLLTACDDVPEKPSKLMLAAAAGDLERVESLIERGDNPNETIGLKKAISFQIEGRPYYGQTALMFAVEAGHVDSVSALLEAGARPDKADSQNRDSWRRACDAPLLSNSEEILTEMLASHQPPFKDVCNCARDALKNIELVKMLWSDFEERACIEEGLLQSGQLMSAAIGLNSGPAVEFLYAEGVSRPEGAIPLAVEATIRQGDTYVLGFLLQNGFSKEEKLSNGLGVEEVIGRTEGYEKASTELQIRQLLNQY
jgi:hypothetical protein